MATTARVKFGPADHGRAVTAEEAEGADYVEGYTYEIIDGRFYVSPKANVPECTLNDWLIEKLRDYVRAHPEVLNKVTPELVSSFPTSQN
jgi:hypothetical protein